LSKERGGGEAEFALLISDQWQHLGLGAELLRSLVHIGRCEKLNKITGQVLSENHAMLTVCKKVGFELHHNGEAGEYKAVIHL
jgi:acetyltransferase